MKLYEQAGFTKDEYDQLMGRLTALPMRGCEISAARYKEIKMKEIANERKIAELLQKIESLEDIIIRQNKQISQMEYIIKGLLP